MSLGFLVLAVPPAHAQTTTASIRGVVRTRDGGPAPGALVLARSEATGAERSAAADALGRYRIDLLPPGEWTITARLGDALASGPRTVALHLQQSLTLDLEVGSALTETVTVRAEAPLVDPARTASELRMP